MKNFQTHNNYKLKGCSVTVQGSAVTVAGGSEMGEIYTQLDKINQTIVGGNGETVGAAGYLTSAGHSILSPRRGLGADQVIEMEIVTPQGKIVTANECQHQDLFWASRGVSYNLITRFHVQRHLSED